MDKTQHNFAVLFADVAGSTHIYEQFGDTKASHIVNSVLSMMTDIVEQHAGTLIKTIGDEVMCRFYDVNHAIEAACEIHEKLDKAPPSRETKLAVRIGLHWGPALLQDDGDLLGDVVNVAARMTSIAQARQIITTGDAVANLSPLLTYKCREFDRAEVKGKSEPLIIYEVVWEPQDVTRMAPITAAIPKVDSPSSLEIRYQDIRKTISSESGSISLGRGDQCDLIVHSPLASRSHAEIKYSRGKFILVDQSTNGTYVCFSDGKKFYLRRESLPLSGSGVINLGEDFTQDDTHSVHFKL